MVSALLNGAQKLVTDDVEKAGVLSTFFATASANKSVLQVFQACENGTLVVEDQIDGQLNWKSMNLRGCTPGAEGAG